MLSKFFLFLGPGLFSVYQLRLVSGGSVIESPTNNFKGCKYIATSGLFLLVSIDQNYVPIIGSLPDVESRCYILSVNDNNTGNITLKN